MLVMLSVSPWVNLPVGPANSHLYTRLRCVAQVTLRDTVNAPCKDHCLTRVFPNYPSSLSLHNIQELSTLTAFKLYYRF